MKIHAVSDLHLEFQQDGGMSVVSKLPECDVLILAGDLTSGPHLFGALKMISKRFPDTQILYVPGNHDWYNSHQGFMMLVYNRVCDQLPNVRWMDCDIVKVGHQRFVGTTLWFPYTESAKLHRDLIADFSYIKGFNDWIPEAFPESRDFLQKNVRSDDIVITHHLPSEWSVADRYKNDPLNCYFLGDVHHIIVEKQPKAWVHGHTHDPCDYKIGKTRVVCNPLGYPTEGGALRNKPDKLVLI